MNKGMTLIKLIENRSYKFFAYIFIVGVVFCWFSFFFLSMIEHGIEPTVGESKEVTLFDAFYFSVVTISSLGYGDFRPVGFGRVIAIIEVIYGLIVVALTVSKVASERTSVLVRLVYTSDIERRIRMYIEENEKKNSDFRYAMKSHDYEALRSIAERFRSDFSSYLHFFVYNIRDGHLEGRWAEKLFLRLLRSVSTSTDLVTDFGRLSNLESKERNSCNKALKRAKVLATTFSEKYDEQNIKGISNHIHKMIGDYEGYISKLSKGEAIPVALSEFSEELVEKVREELPSDKPWKKNIHKEIAQKLRISNKLSHKCISKIVSDEEELAES